MAKLEVEICLKVGKKQCTINKEIDDLMCSKFNDELMAIFKKMLEVIGE